MNKQLLFLHGAGRADKNRYKFLLEELNRNGIESFSFNFTGHSGINLQDSSLSERYDEAKTEIKRFKLKEPLNLMGSSMGGYISIKLLQQFEVKNLILFCPALYDVGAFDISFGPEFSKIIRKPNSWVHSDAYGLAKGFSGNVLIVIGDQDEVVPKKLIDLLNKSFINAKSKETVIIPGATHALADYLKVNPALIKQTAERITHLL